jgi:hypothetical protein
MTVRALRYTARRIQHLAAEAAGLRAELDRLVAALAPWLLELLGVGPISAAQVLVSWSYAGRLRSDAAFAALAGANPIPASSGQVTRHRLNRSGDRQLNRALHTVVVARLRNDRLRTGGSRSAGVPAGIRSPGRMDPRRPHARPPGPHHRRHTHGRERIARPPNPATGPQRRVPRTRRRLRFHARAARSTRRRTAEIRSQRLPRTAHPAGDLADPSRRRPQRPEPGHRRTEPGHGRTRRPPHAVNARAIDLTEALLLLSRTDQRSFTRQPVDLSLIAEEATETLLPLAEKHGVTIQTSGDIAPTIGSHALLLQMTTNLLHNAIVHNLPEQGTVRVTTSVRPKSVMLTVENTGDKLTPQLVSTLTEPFQRGTERLRTDHAGVGLGLAIVKSITQAHDGTLTITPRPAGGLCVTVQLPAAPPHTGR